MKNQRLMMWCFVILMFWQIGLFGQRHEGKFPAVFNLDDINGTNGYVIDGITYFPFTKGQGDVNGDGVDDVLVGAPFSWVNDKLSSDAYIIFGNKEKRPASIDVKQLDDNKGVTIRNCGGTYVTILGDINGDGISDILIGDSGINLPGPSCIIFGMKDWPIEVFPYNLNGNNGFIINGGYYTTASGVGDINGDGFGDIIVGAYHPANDGKSYVVFGKQRWPKTINLLDLDGINGFVINGINKGDEVGYAVSGAGDFNGDGIDDAIIGAPYGNNGTGQSYIIFGNEEWSAIFNLKDLNGKNGFAINGINKGDGSGFSLSGVEDINNDGINDVIIGAPYANKGSDSHGTGQSYVIFGSNISWPALFYLGDLNGDNGVTFNGVNQDDRCGFSVSGIGDFNADNISDIIICAYGTSYYKGECYVVFGSKKWSPIENLSNLNGINGFIVNKTNNSGIGIVVNGIGDVNGDLVDDVLIGEFHTTLGKDPGPNYVLFGCCGEVPPPLPPDDHSLALGLGISGGVVGLVALGVSGYYGYQWYYRSSYEAVE